MPALLTSAVSGPGARRPPNMRMTWSSARRRPGPRSPCRLRPASRRPAPRRSRARVVDRDRVAAPGGEPGRRRADAARAAGHQHDPTQGVAPFRRRPPRQPPPVLPVSCGRRCGRGRRRFRPRPRRSPLPRGEPLLGVVDVLEDHGFMRRALRGRSRFPRRRHPDRAAGGDELASERYSYCLFQSTGRRPSGSPRRSPGPAGPRAGSAARHRSSSRSRRGTCARRA